MSWAWVSVCSLGCAGGAWASGAAPSVATLLVDLACERDSDCQTVPLAEQACGGPSGWLAYSVRRTRKDALLGALKREAQPVANRVSTCMVIADPGAVCAKSADAAAEAAGGQCRLAAPQGALPAK